MDEKLCWIAANSNYSFTLEDDFLVFKSNQQTLKLMGQLRFKLMSYFLTTLNPLKRWIDKENLVNFLIKTFLSLKILIPFFYAVYLFNLY